MTQLFHSLLRNPADAARGVLKDDVVAVHILVFHFRCFKLLTTKIRNFWNATKFYKGFLEESAQIGGDLGWGSVGWQN